MTENAIKRFFAIFVPLSAATALPTWLTVVTKRGHETLVAILLTAGSFLASLVAVWLVDSFRQRRRQPSVSEQEPRPRAGLIMTVGPGSLDKRNNTTAFDRLLWHVQPTHVVLVGTGKTEEMYPIFEQKAKSVAKQPWLAHLTVDPDAIDLSGLRAAFHQLQAQKVARDDIVVDITGGTLSMSLSAYFGAQECGLETQLIQQDRDRFHVIGP